MRVAAVLASCLLLGVVVHGWELGFVSCTLEDAVVELDDSLDDGTGGYFVVAEERVLAESPTTVTITNSDDEANIAGFLIFCEDGSGNRLGSFSSQDGVFLEGCDGAASQVNASNTLSLPLSLTWTAPALVASSGESDVDAPTCVWRTLVIATCTPEASLCTEPVAFVLSGVPTTAMSQASLDSHEDVPYNITGRVVLSNEQTIIIGLAAGVPTITVVVCGSLLYIVQRNKERRKRALTVKQIKQEKAKKLLKKMNSNSSLVMSSTALASAEITSETDSGSISSVEST